LDGLKAELGFWEKIFFALFAAIFGMAGWFSSNYKDVDTALLIATSFFCFCGYMCTCCIPKS